jgi:hypothetical protein
MEEGFMLSRLIGLICACALLAVSPIAGASSITLSNVSSDFGEPTGSTDPADLDALLDFQVSGSTLTLSVTNNTAAPNTFDITEVFFNATADITSLSLTSPAAAGVADTNPTGWDFSTGTNADGFGSFDFAVKLFGDINLNPNIVSPSETEILTFALTCAGGATCDMTDFVDTNVNDFLAAAKFVNGPDQNPGGEVPDPDSAFGGTVVPVPAAVWLFGSGLLGLVGVARRKKQ